MHRRTSGALVLGILAFFAAAPRQVQATIDTWVAATDINWATTTNWKPNRPASGDSLVFAASASSGLDLNNNLTSSTFDIGGISFTPGAAAFVIGDGSTNANAGDAFLLSGSVTNSGTNLETINNPFGLAASEIIAPQASGGIALGGNIGGTGFGLVKAGTGTLILSGTNTYSGGTTINAGIVQAGNNSALGASSAALAVNGGEFDVHGYSVNVGQLSGTGTIDNLNGSGALTVGNGDASSTFTGTMQNTSGQLALNKTGSGTFGLDGIVVLAGTATVSGGVLSQSGGLLQPAAVVVDGGGL